MPSYCDTLPQLKFCMQLPIGMTPLISEGIQIFVVVVP